MAINNVLNVSTLAFDTLNKISKANSEKSNFQSILKAVNNKSDDGIKNVTDKELIDTLIPAHNINAKSPSTAAILSMLSNNVDNKLS